MSRKVNTVTANRKSKKQNTKLFTILSLCFPLSIVVVIISELLWPSIGANIGAGILGLLGLILSIVGLVGLINVGTKKQKRISVTALATLVIAFFLVPYLFNKWDSKMFCQAQYKNNYPIPPEMVETCKKYYPNFEFQVIEY